MEQNIIVLTFTELRDHVIKDEAGQKKIGPLFSGEIGIIISALLSATKEKPTGVKTKKFILEFSTWVGTQRCNYLYNLPYYKNEMKYGKGTLLYFDVIPKTIEDVYSHFLGISVIATRYNKSKEIDLFCATKTKGSILMQYIFNTLYPNEKIWKLEAADDKAKEFWEKHKFVFNYKKNAPYRGLRGAPVNFATILKRQYCSVEAEEYLQNNAEFVRSEYAQQKLKKVVKYEIKHGSIQTKILEVFLKNIHNDKNFYPMHWCILKGMGEHFKICLKYTHDVNQTDSKDRTALELAIAANQKTIISMLLEMKEIDVSNISTKILTMTKVESLTDDKYMYDELNTNLLYWDTDLLKAFLSRTDLHPSITSDFIRKIRDIAGSKKFYYVGYFKRQEQREIFDEFIRRKDRSRETGEEESALKHAKQRIVASKLTTTTSCILCCISSLK